MRHDDGQMDQLLSSGAAPEPSGACVDTPEFDLGRLLALREDDEAAHAHLAACAFCRALLVDARTPAHDLLVARADRAWPRAAPRRLWAAVAVGAFAAAAALFLVLRTPSMVAPPGFELEGPLGGEAAVRSDAPESDVFRPTSQVRLALRPAAPVTGSGPAVAVFVAPAGGPLRRLPDALSRREPNGTVLVRGDGRAVFGEQPGRLVVYVVVATDPGQLSGLEGSPAPEARGRDDGTRWYEREVTYRLE